jgi:hypothetical protein
MRVCPASRIPLPVTNHKEDYPGDTAQNTNEMEVLDLNQIEAWVGHREWPEGFQIGVHDGIQ